MAADIAYQKPPPRPFGIVLLALVQLWHGFWYLVLALVFLAVSSTAEAAGNQDKGGLAFLLMLVYLVLGIYALWLARGYIKGYEWARRRGISVAVFAIVLGLVGMLIIRLQLLIPDSPFWTFVGNIIIIWYLGREKTKRYFASRSESRRR